jgi:peptide/nickel transport system substrate-binding protein
VVLAGTVVFAAACGGNKSSGGERTNKVVEAKPVKGKTLTLGAPAPAATLNPAKINAAFSDYSAVAYEALIRRASSGELAPGLATEWKWVGEGNTRLELKLRPNVKFADGDPVTPAAVKASLEYSMSPGNNGAAGLPEFDHVEVAGSESIAIVLKSGNPTLPQLLTPKWAIGQIISPKGLADPSKLEVTGESHGAGPYVYQPGESIAGDHYTYTANPDYFDKDRQYFDKLVIRVISDPQAALNALRTGQIDVTSGSAKTADQAEAAGLQVAATPFVCTGLNLIDRTGEVVKELGDVRVRQAMNYAVDRKKLTSAVVGKWGMPTTQLVPEGWDGYSKNAAERYPYDPAKAKALLAEAGHPDGFTLKVLSTGLGGMGTIVEALKGELAAVGIKLEVEEVNDEKSLIVKGTNKTFGATALGYGAQPLAMMAKALWTTSGVVFNPFKNTDPNLDDLAVQAAKAPDAQRKDLESRIMERLTDQAWFVPVAFMPVFYFARADLGGLQVTPGAPTASPLDWYNTK